MTTEVARPSADKEYDDLQDEASTTSVVEVLNYSGALPAAASDELPGDSKAQPPGQGNPVQPQRGVPAVDRPRDTGGIKELQVGNIWEALGLQKDAPKDAKQPFLPSVEATPEELERAQFALPISPELQKKLAETLKLIKQEHAEHWKKVKELINSSGTDPLDAMLGALKDSRVIGIGEMHTLNHNALRRWGVDNMKQLHDKGGMTHLGIEMPSILKPVFDKFNSGKGPLEIPDKLLKPDGTEDTSPEAVGALKFLRKVQEKDPEMLALWTAARDAGVKLVPVDHPGTGLQFEDPTNPNIPKMMRDRDKVMAENILAITNGDKSAKVGAWLGSLHFADDGEKGKGRSAGEILREELSKKGEKFTSFYTQIGNGPFAPGTSLFPLTTQLTKPVSVDSKDAKGKPNALGEVNMFAQPDPAYPYTLSNYDKVIIFPKIPEALPELGGFGDRFERPDPAKEAAEIKARMAETQKIVDAMKDQKFEPSKPPVNPFKLEASDWEKLVFGGTADDVIAAKKELNKVARDPFDAIGAAMQDSRVLALTTLYEANEKTAQFADQMMAKLKAAGATHVMLPIDQKILDEFMASGKVDRSKLDQWAPGDRNAILAQAALKHGLKLASIPDADILSHKEAPAQVAAISAILKDKNAKVVYFGYDQNINTDTDKEGAPSSVSLLKDRNDPANPAQKLKVQTVRFEDGIPADLYPFTETLSAPAAVRTSEAKLMGGVKVEGATFNRKVPLSSWDLVVFMPKNP